MEVQDDRGKDIEVEVQGDKGKEIEVQVQDDKGNEIEVGVQHDRGKEIDVDMKMVDKQMVDVSTYRQLCLREVLSAPFPPGDRSSRPRPPGLTHQLVGGT